MKDTSTRVSQSPGRPRASATASPRRNADNLRVGIEVLYLTGALSHERSDLDDREGGDVSATSRRDAIDGTSKLVAQLVSIDALMLQWRGDEAHVIDALRTATAERNRAARTMRLLVAYAREVFPGRPPTLEALADATGLTVSGVRSTYGPRDVHEVEEILGRDAGNGRAGNASS